MDNQPHAEEKPIVVNDAAISSLTSETVLAVPGVHSLSTRFIDGVVEGISNTFGQKRLPGVNVKHRKHNSIEVNIYVNVLYGFSLLALAQEIQQAVSQALASELQLSPVKVDVHLEHLIVPSEEPTNEVK